MNPIAEYLVAALLLLGGAFTLVGAIGLARLPDFFTRLHGPTKATTPRARCSTSAAAARASASPRC